MRPFVVLFLVIAVQSFRSPHRRLLSLSSRQPPVIVKTRLAATKAKATAALAPFSSAPNPFLKFLRSSTKSKVIVAVHVLPLVALYVLVTSAAFKKLVAAAVDFVTTWAGKILPKQQSNDVRAHVIPTPAPPAPRTAPDAPAAPAKSGFITAEESLKKVEAQKTVLPPAAVAKPMGMLRPEPAEPTAAERDEQRRREREAKDKEEQYRQEMRLKRWQQQRAAEKAALSDGTTPERTVVAAVSTVFQADEPLAPEKERDVIGAAALTAAAVGFKLGGPVGALIAASAVSYFGKKDETKAAVVGTGKAALGAVDLLKSVDRKFEVIKATEAVLVEAVATNTKDSVNLVKDTLEATKAAASTALPIVKDTLGSTMDVTDRFLNKVEEIGKTDNDKK